MAAVGAAFFLGTWATPKAKADSVGLELVLMLDISGSIDRDEYALQIEGYRAAFRSSAVQNAILGNSLGSIAVQVVKFGTTADVVSPWYKIDSADSANAFADAFPGGTIGSGGTAINVGLDLSVGLFNNNGYESPRQVIDISGDGVNSPSAPNRNDGVQLVQASRDAALAGGVDAINALVIGKPELRDYFRDNVIGGTGSFVNQVDAFNAFAPAIQAKLVAEISVGSPTPLPPVIYGGVALLGMVGISHARRARRAARLARQA